MQESGDRKTEMAQPKSDATSKETLSDIEESEKESPSSEDQSGPGPAPDGALDERDELKDSGPM